MPNPRLAIATLGLALGWGVSPAWAQPSPEPEGRVAANPPPPGASNPSELQPSGRGPDGEPLTDEGEVIFGEATADSIRVEGEDPPVSPMIEPESPPDQPLRPQHRVEYNNILGLRYNPLGAVDRLDLFYRYRLYDLPGALYRDASFGFGLSPRASPAFARVGPTLEIKPLTILTIQAGYHFFSHFGTFDLLQGFESALDDYREVTMEERSANGEAKAAIGHELQVMAQFLIKVGNVVVRDTLNIYVTQHDLPAGTTLFYDQRHDILRSNGRPTFVNDLDLVYLTDFGLIAGARFNATHHLYDAEADYRPGETVENPNEILRLGPLFAYRFDDVDPTFRAPTILFLTAWHIKHRWRTGVEFSPMLPNISLAFVFSGDVWNSNVGWAGSGPTEGEASEGGTDASALPSVAAF